MKEYNEEEEEEEGGGDDVKGPGVEEELVWTDMYELFFDNKIEPQNFDINEPTSSSYSTKFTADNIVHKDRNRSNPC